MSLRLIDKVFGDRAKAYDSIDQIISFGMKANDNEIVKLGGKLLQSLFINPPRISDAVLPSNTVQRMLVKGDD